MVKIAILGCGRIGAMHALNIHRHEKADLAAAFDVHAPSAEAVGKKFSCRVAPSVDDILSDSAVDAVLVATTTDTHADLIEAAVRAGKAVLCEKPIDLSLERVNRCAEAISGTDVPVQIGFNRRFDPGHRAARQAMLDGEIGDLHQVIITSRDPGMPPRSYIESAGGLLRDMTIHDFDLARYMLNDEPVEVYAVADALIDPELGRELDDVDTAMIIMRTADGKMCHINNSRTATYGYDQRIELLGRDGMVISDNRKPHEMRRYSEKSTEVSEPYLHFFIERYEQSFNAEIASFATAVETGGPTEVSFEDGRRALMLAEAAYLSRAEGRAVKVDEVG